MVEYKCGKCNKVFSRKSHYEYHKNRKISCIPSSRSTAHVICQNNASKSQCSYCNKKFSRTDSLNRHISKYCKIKANQDNQKEDLLQILINDMAEMKEEICRLKSEKKYVRINTKIENQFNQQNIINANIRLLAFGKEDITHIVDEVYKKILNRGFKSVPTLVEQVHFNKDKPENHNIYISNIRTNYVLVYDGDDWKLKERCNILQQLVDDKTDILSDKFDELITKLDEPTIRKFQRFLDQRDEDNVISNIKNDLKLLLYNNKKIPEATRELIRIGQ